MKKDRSILNFLRSDERLFSQTDLQFTMIRQSVHRNSLQTKNSFRVRPQLHRNSQSILIIPKDLSENSNLSTKRNNLLSDVYNEFANESSIHGIKYTSRAKSPGERIFWMIIIILSIVAAGILAQKFYYRHKQANMRTLVISNQYPSWKTPLPAITVCHPTLVARHRLEEYMNNGTRLKMPLGMKYKDFENDLHYLTEALNPTNQFNEQLKRLNEVLGMNNLTLLQLFEITSSPCSDFIVLCRFEGEIKSCDNLLKRSVTSYGLCCSFNYAYVDGERRWTNDEEYYSVHFGLNFILSILIKNYDIGDRISGAMYGDGVRVLIHDRYSYPGPNTQELVASHGNEVVVYLSSRVLTASKEVLRLSPNERGCFTSVSSTNYYRADNCFAECQENLYKLHCNCLPFYSSVLDDNLTVCNFTHSSCLAGVKEQVLELSLWGQPCNCLPDCDGAGYSIVTTTIPMNAVRFNPSRFYQTALKYPNSTAIHITFSRQTASLLRRDLVLSWINLISSLGGVFSLFLGCSFISIVEIIYFVIYYISKATKKRKTPKLSLRT